MSFFSILVLSDVVDVADPTASFTLFCGISPTREVLLGEGAALLLLIDKLSAP